MGLAKAGKWTPLFIGRETVLYSTVLTLMPSRGLFILAVLFHEGGSGIVPLGLEEALITGRCFTGLAL